MKINRANLIHLLTRMVLTPTLTALVVLSSTPARTFQFGKKPYQQWTAKEVEKMLANSAWAQTQVGVLSIGRNDPVVQVADSGITVRLRSALPMRQALARLNQIKLKYEQRTDSERAAIDERNRELLQCPECADNYVVSITVAPGSRNELPGFLSAGRTSFEAMRQNVILENENHETRELKRFVGPKFSAGEALFFFARLDQSGNPLISPKSRTVIISLDPRVFGWKKATVTKFKFAVATMIIDGKVAF